MKRSLVLFLLAVLVMATWMSVGELMMSSVQTSISGMWTIEWLKLDGTSYSPRNTNPLTLTTTPNGFVTGEYVSDNKELCGVNGVVSGVAVAFTVQCRSWKGAFAGTLSNSNMTIDGTYVVPPGGKYVSGTHGFFTAERSICSLPEGCTAASLVEPSAQKL
jgi:hypothetical protein